MRSSSQMRDRCDVAIFDSGGVKTRFLLEGKGPLIVLIQGVGARLENWDSVASRLTDEFRVLRYDLRGHGESTRAPGPYSLPLLADDLKALLDHIGADEANVAGHSLGGMIAQ